MKSVDFLQKKWFSVASTVGFFSVILAFGNNIKAIWILPETVKQMQQNIKELEKRQHNLENSKCDALRVQQTVLHTTTQTFRSILVVMPRNNPQAIEIIKENGKASFEKQKEEIAQLKKNCNV